MKSANKAILFSAITLALTGCAEVGYTPFGDSMSDYQPTVQSVEITEETPIVEPINDEPTYVHVATAEIVESKPLSMAFKVKQDVKLVSRKHNLKVDYVMRHKDGSWHIQQYGSDAKDAESEDEREVSLADINSFEVVK